MQIFDEALPLALRSSGRRNPAQVIAHKLKPASLASVLSTRGKHCEVRPLTRSYERPDDERDGTQDRVDLAIGAGRPQKSQEECDGGPEQQVRRKKANRRQGTRHLAGLQDVPAFGASLGFWHSHAHLRPNLPPTAPPRQLTRGAPIANVESCQRLERCA